MRASKISYYSRSSADLLQNAFYSFSLRKLDLLFNMLCISSLANLPGLTDEKRYVCALYAESFAERFVRRSKLPLMLCMYEAFVMTSTAGKQSKIWSTTLNGAYRWRRSMMTARSVSNFCGQ